MTARRLYFLPLILALLLGILPQSASSLYLAEGYASYRAEVGLKLFRSLLSSDLQLSKKTDENQQLPVLIVYVSQPADAIRYQQELTQQMPALAGLTTSVQTIRLDDFLSRSQPVAGVFIAQQLTSDEIQALVKQGNNRQIAVFSPFEGDVEQGVLAGISVQAAVRPYINSQTLKDSGVQLKDFYLKAALRYE